MKEKRKQYFREVKKLLEMEDYYNCLLEEGQNKKYVHFYFRRTEDHEIYLGKINKLAINSFDDNRYFINKVESFPWEKQTRFFLYNRSKNLDHHYC